MTVSAKLSRMARCHLAAGIIFSLALCAYLLIENYRASVIEIRSGVASIRSNAASMAEDTGRIEERQTQVLRALPAGHESNSPREVMLLSVEKLKAGIKGASIALDEFSETGAILSLPLIVEFDTASFEEGVKGIEAIQSLNMPYFEFRNIDIRRLEGSYSSARYKVEGVMTMPAGKITGPSGTERTS
jgi:hypothetical protein